MKKVLVLGILCMFMIFLGSCEKSSPTSPTVPVVPVVSDPPTISSFTATPSEIFKGNNSTLSWSVSNATTVSIDQGIGNVSNTGNREVGPTVTTSYTLTATNSHGTVTKSCTVTVKEPATATSVKVTSQRSLICIGQKEQMTATTTMSDGTTKDTIGMWGSHNTNVATVNQRGLVTAISSGTVTIYIDTTEGGLRGKKKLRVRTLWSKSGKGDNVFNMPTYVSRVRIIGTYTGYAANFIVHINGSYWINELMGIAFSQTHFTGTYRTSGGLVEILSSSGVSWSFTEVSSSISITNTTRKLYDVPSQSDPCYREYEIYKRVKKGGVKHGI